MSTSDEICFGLYLGNSSCSLAVNKKGAIEVPANAAGHRITPAVVALANGGEVLTGLPAQQGLIRYSKQSVVGVLRDICSEDTEASPSCQTCPPIYSETGEISYLLDEETKKSIKASEVLEKIFVEMMDIASHHEKEEFHASLCLPSWVTEAAVTMCVEAAHAAGFNLLSVLLQPTAACLAYDLLDRTKNEHVLTLHLGDSGGSASLLRVSGGVTTLLESKQLTMKPGNAITAALSEHLANEFYKKYRGDPRENRRSRQKLSVAAAGAKHLLSRMSEAQVTCECLWEGVDFATKINRSRFEMLVGSTLQSFVSPLSELLTAAGLDSEHVQHVVLSGGTCHMPRLQSLVASAFPAAAVRHTTSPDEVLAFGAAREARTLLSMTTQGTQNGVSAAPQQNGAPVEGAGKGKKAKNKKKKGGADQNAKNNNNNAAANGVASNPAKKKKRKPVTIKADDHQATSVATVGVPVWCQAPGGTPYLLLGLLCPPLVKTSLSLPLPASPPFTVTVFESATVPTDPPTPDQVLATVSLPESATLKEVTLTCQLKPDGTIALLITDPVSKKSKQVLIAADAEDAELSS